MRHKIGTTSSSVGISAIPPIPVPAASPAPNKAGLDGTNFAIQVGRKATSFVSHQKLSRKPGTAFVNHILGLLDSTCLNTSWSRENNPRAPGIAIDMDQSS